MTLQLAQSRSEGDKDYEKYIEYGQIMLTTAVFSVCLTAPLGAIMINTLGTKWLSYDGPAESHHDGNKVSPDTEGEVMLVSAPSDKSRNTARGVDSTNPGGAANPERVIEQHIEEQAVADQDGAEITDGAKF